MKRNNNETYLQFCKRATDSLSNGQIELNEWASAVFGEDAGMYSAEYIRRVYVFFKQFVSRLESEDYAVMSDDDKLAQVKNILNEIRAEKIKVRTANLEYNANARADAREDMFREQIISAINRLEPIKHSELIYTPEVGTSGLLCLSDFHAGSTYEIKGLYGEVINKYSYDIMTARLWRLLSQLEAEDMPYDDLTIALMGDFTENILRDSSLTKLREPVTDTLVRFSEFMANWIVAVHDKLNVPINVVVVGGNHDINRILGTKPQFEGENTAKIVDELLKLRIALSGIKDITVDDYTDCAIKTIRGTNIMFEHGDGDAVTTMNYYENIYNISIDEGYFGHLHRQESKSAGIADVGDRMCYRVGSIAGVDTFAKKLRKASRASATFATYTNNGREWAKTYYLN